MKTEILGVRFDKVTGEEALERVLGYLKDGGTHTVFTPNPEMVMKAHEDEEFREVLNGADLVIPDGIGVVYASRLKRARSERLKERVTGYDLLQGMFRVVCKMDYTVYFIGGAPGVAEKAREKMVEKYKGLKIVGVRDGYFDDAGETEIFDDILAKKPDIILVGIGFPKQEKWIKKNKDMLSARLYVGVGGSFDGMAGIVPRAPVFFQKMGLEWFYRLIKQPSRFKRQLRLPLFMIEAVKERLYDR